MRVFVASCMKLCARGWGVRAIVAAAPTGNRMRKLPRGQLYFDPIGVCLDAVESLLPHQRGELVRRFEQEFAATVRAPYAVALPHARVALRFLLEVLAFPPGSEVVMSPVTIPEIVAVILERGLRPVFADLGERTCNVDCDDLERKITPRTKLVLVTHLCGIPSEMERIVAIAERHGLEVLEDCSQVPGTKHRGRALGTWGRAGFFSLTPLKPVSTFHGGMAVTTDRVLAEELRSVARKHATTPSTARISKWVARDVLLDVITRPAAYTSLTHHIVKFFEAVDPEVVREFGRGNFFRDPERRYGAVQLGPMPSWRFASFTDFQARSGLRATRRLARDNERRRELSLALLDALRARGVGGLLSLRVDPKECTFWRFPLWIEPGKTDAPYARRESLRRHLRERGIDSSPTNLMCCSRMPEFAEYAADTPAARAFVDDMIFLPMHPNLRYDEMLRIADAVGEHASASAG
jgi:perosamine synthetase